MQRKVQDKHAPSCWLFICPHVTSIPTLPIRKPFYYLTVTPKAKLASGNTSIKYKLITKLCPHLWWRVKWRQCYSHKSTLCWKGFAPPHCTGGNTEAQRAQPRPECRTLSLLWFTHHLSPKWEAEALAEPLTVICLARPGWATRKGEGSCHYDMPRPWLCPHLPANVWAPSPPAQSRNKRTQQMVTSGFRFHMERERKSSLPSLQQEKCWTTWKWRTFLWWSIKVTEQIITLTTGETGTCAEDSLLGTAAEAGASNW